MRKGKKLIALCLLSMLTGCGKTYVSKELLPLPDLQETGKERSGYPSRVFNLDSAWDTHNVCSKINGLGNGIVSASLLIWIQACSVVPINPLDPCIIIYTTGDFDNYYHESRHCDGHKDTFDSKKALKY